MQHWEVHILQFVALFHVYRDHQKDADFHIGQFVALLHVYRGDQKYLDLQIKLSKGAYEKRNVAHAAELDAYRRATSTSFAKFILVCCSEGAS